MLIVRFLLLVVVLNVIRYLVGGAAESVLIFPGLMGAMEQSPSYFNGEFTTLDWVTSFAYNFVMWLTVVWVFHLMRPRLRGSDIRASLVVFALMWMFFASVSAIYMNHYSHPKAFYGWNIVDAVLAFAIVGIGNGLLYRRLLGQHAAVTNADA